MNATNNETDDKRREAPAVVDKPVDDRDKLPFVSVIIPIRNEAKFIERLLGQLLSQDYPTDRIEIVIADGMSDDGTRDILDRYVREFPRIRVVDNPRRVTPTALNAAILAARGEIISRVDGHCEVAPDFVRQNVQLIAGHPEAWVVGGPIVHEGKNRFGRAVAVAMSHPAGVGMATHRFEGYEGYVDSTQFPTFHRWVFDRVGLFDEGLVRTEDDELNYRVTQAGGKSYVSPRVKYVYYVRGRIGQLFKQYYQYSFWRIPVIRKHKKPTTLRQVVPPLFFLTMFVLVLVGIWLRQPLVALALPAAYATALVAVGISVVPRKGLAVAALVPLALATMHLAYATGFLYGFLALLFHRKAWDIGGRMTTISR